MLTLHAFATPNSLKPAIALEEMGLPYHLQPVDLRKGEQRSDAFRAMNPNSKVPVLVDGDLVLSESAAILVHLAETSGQLLPTAPAARAKVFEQLFFHASAVSPAFLQASFW
jgi:GST-like protein